MANRILDVIRRLEGSGHHVTYRKRPDGGYIITSINGVKYRAAEGNNVARAMTGIEESVARRRQREYINRRATKGSASAKKRKKGFKKNPLPYNVEKLFKKAQREWRKGTDPTISGRITKRKVERSIQERGLEETVKSLERDIAYAKGYAYEENVLHLADRIRMAVMNASSQEAKERLRGIADRIESMASEFKEAWIAPINQIMYDADQIHPVVGDSAYLNAIFEIERIIG